MSYLLKMGCSRWSIFILQESSPHFTKKLLVVLAKNADGFRVGFGKYGLILITYVAHLTGIRIVR